MKTSFITGISGQDGSYLAEFLLERDYRVHGLIRRASTGPALANLQAIKNDITLHEGDLSDADFVSRTLDDLGPSVEVYNLGAQSFVPLSWEAPSYTLGVNTFGFLNVLEACRRLNDEYPKMPVRVYQASTSEMYGNHRGLLDENAPMIPRSPYGVAKLASHRLARVYRESYGMFIACGVLFNHESPRRGEMFVTRKITKAVAQIAKGTQKSLMLGNIQSKRDWGFAGDYVRAMWLMLQQDKPDDFVIGTGAPYSVEDFVVFSFEAANELLDRELDWTKYTKHDDKFDRPADIEHLCADSRKAEEVLGWKPMVDCKALAHMMVKADLTAEGLL